jgi:hypothetical protein
MASEPSRGTAKQAMHDREHSDPELDETLAAGTRLQLDLVKENNRHAEANASRELGFLGKAFGGEKSAPTFVALVAVIAGVVGYGTAMWLASQDAASAEFWGTQMERALAFASAALAFIFGRGSKSS